MTYSKKLLFGITISTLLVMSSAVIMTNNTVRSNSIVNGIKPNNLTVPAEVDYSGYRKITTTGTLVRGASVVIVKHKDTKYYASTTTFDANHFMVTQEVTLSSGGFSYSDPYTYDYYVADETIYSRFMKGENHLARYDEENGLCLTGGYSKLTIELNGSGDARIYYTKPASVEKRKITFSTASGNRLIQDDYTDNYNLEVYANVDSVVESWASEYLRMPFEVDNQCELYLTPARNALLAMDEFVRADLYRNPSFKDYKDRYEAWCAHQHVDPYNE